MLTYGISGVLKNVENNNNNNEYQLKTVIPKLWYEPNRGFCEPFHSCHLRLSDTEEIEASKLEKDLKLIVQKMTSKQ